MGQPAVMTPRGVRRCALCRTDDYGLPSGPRQGEGHVSVRFGDGTRGFRVVLNGEDVTNDAYEAFAGERGFVALYDRTAGGERFPCPHSDPSDRHALIYLELGRVDVIRPPAR